jgi:hypothetical protein
MTFESTIAVFEREKTVYTLSSAATVIGINNLIYRNIKSNTLVVINQNISVTDT